MSETLIRIATGIVAGIVFFGAYFFSPHLFSLLLLSILGFIIVKEWALLCKKINKLWFVTPLYPVLPVISLVGMQYLYRPLDIFIPLYPFFVSWAADTGGYFFGITFGSHKICPRISKKKTWEGFLGSFLMVFFVSWILIKTRPMIVFWGVPKNIFFLGIISLMLSAVAFLGDLFESFLKRKAKLKDSGSLLPGHGGLLDRFDSVFLVAPVILIAKYLLAYVFAT